MATAPAPVVTDSVICDEEVKVEETLATAETGDATPHDDEMTKAAPSPPAETLTKLLPLSNTCCAPLLRTGTALGTSDVNDMMFIAPASK